MQQKILSRTLTVLMVLGFGLTLSGFMPTAQAADAVSTEAELLRAIKDGNYITLDADITLRSAVNISDKTITIDGRGHKITLYNYGYRHFIVEGSSDISLKNLTLQGNTEGGGIDTINSNLTMEQSTIVDCVANEDGGGLYANTNSIVSLTGSTISNCTANKYGGGLYAHTDSTVSLSGSIVTNCSANKCGGGLYANTDSAISISSSTISNCSANIDGGGLYANTDYTVNIMSSKIEGCTAAVCGGGVEARSNTTVSITDTFIENCTAITGGGLDAYKTTVNFTNCSITNCTATNGGGVSSYYNSTVSLADSSITNCTANDGGGIYAYINSAANLTNSNITNCTATNCGGGICANLSSAVNLTNSSITYCTASVDGGGTYLDRDSSIKSDDTTRYNFNYAVIPYVGKDNTDIKYASLSIVTSYDTDGTPIYIGPLNGYDIYWLDNMGPELYIISFESNGGTEIKHQFVAGGSTVAEPTAPSKAGYAFGGWYADNTLTEEYSFDTMVTGGFTLYARWLHEPYIEGYYNNTFRPDSAVSRAEVAKMLYAVSGESITGTDKFEDVESGAWYYDAVTYLTDRGVISGYPDGSFQPDSRITRAELVKMAVIYAGLTVGSETDKYFPDVPSDYWAAGYINTARNARYVNGYLDGYFQPEQSITRAETVKILNAVLGRTIENSILDSLTIPFTDVPDTHWAYYDILEASVEHPH